MSLSLVTAPATPLFTLSDLKAPHLRVTHTDANNDTGINDYIATAEAMLDGPNGMVGRPLITQTWDYALPEFEGNLIDIPLTPAQTLDSITYFDKDNASQTFSTSNVIFIKHDDKTCVQIGEGQNWPSTYNRPDAVTFRVTCGYGDAATDVPDVVLGAGRLLIAHLYNNREAIASNQMAELPMGVADMLSTVRRGWAGA